MKHSVIQILFLVAAILLLNSCATYQAETQPEQQAEKLVPIKSITVLPVKITIDEKAPPDAIQKAQLAEGKEVLDRLLAEHFAGQPSITFLSDSDIEGLAIDFSLCNTYMERSRAICLNVGSDAALVVNLYRYIEREGKTYGVEQPASVSFNYKLVEVKTGNTLCWGHFDETQKPLFDDLFSIFSKTKKRGVKWITAAELAKEGIQTKFNNCPYLVQ